jgi:NADH:ubiquinone oxidoreductase subunit 5 (subunit L)/multisubunit Na+/H+ antiporter MnhA subunit
MHIISGFSSISCTLISIVIFYQVALNQSPCHISLAPFFIVNYTTPTGVLFDTLTAVMCFSHFSQLLVVLFSFSYMIQDPHFIRFISYLKLFTVAMLVLVTADNMIQLFVGWECWIS